MLLLLLLLSSHMIFKAMRICLVKVWFSSGRCGGFKTSALDSSAHKLFVQVRSASEKEFVIISYNKKIEMKINAGGMSDLTRS